MLGCLPPVRGHGSLTLQRNVPKCNPLQGLLALRSRKHCECSWVGVRLAVCPLTPERVPPTLSRGAPERLGESHYTELPPPATCQPWRPHFSVHTVTPSHTCEWGGQQK